MLFSLNGQYGHVTEREKEGTKQPTNQDVFSRMLDSDTNLLGESATINTGGGGRGGAGVEDKNQSGACGKLLRCTIFGW